MRILFDQGAPVPLRRWLSPHEVATAWQRGWETLSNGELLLAAEGAGFDLLVTMHCDTLLAAYTAFHGR